MNKIEQNLPVSNYFQILNTFDWLYMAKCICTYAFGGDYNLNSAPNKN